jgi:hypothetical protein
MRGVGTSLSYFPLSRFSLSFFTPPFLSLFSHAWCSLRLSHGLLWKRRQSRRGQRRWTKRNERSPKALPLPPLPPLPPSSPVPSRGICFLSSLLPSLFLSFPSFSLRLRPPSGVQPRAEEEGGGGKESERRGRLKREGGREIWNCRRGSFKILETKSKEFFVTFMVSLFSILLWYFPAFLREKNPARTILFLGTNEGKKAEKGERKKSKGDCPGYN